MKGATYTLEDMTQKEIQAIKEKAASLAKSGIPSKIAHDTALYEYCQEKKRGAKSHSSKASPYRG